MNERWIPQPEKHPDVGNIYDMMLVFQEQLDQASDHYSKMHEAKVALSALGHALDRLDDDKRQISMTTELALIDDTKVPNKGALVKNIGMAGLVDRIDVVKLGEHMPLSLSLGVDVMCLFPRHAPDELDYVVTGARTPIQNVHYIETYPSL